MDPNTQIALTTDKRGRRLAFRWSIAAGGRWFRIPLAIAELMLATGTGCEVPYPQVTR